MESCPILIILLCLTSINADKVTKNGVNLQLVFETTNNYVIELGKLETYTNLKYGNEKITITCNKINCYENGNLLALVNSVPARPLGQCIGESNIKCKTQKFEFELGINDSSFFEIQCRYAEDTRDSVFFNLYRLYSDSFPRIRSGSKLDKLGNVITHNLNEERISCEALKISSKPNVFDEINWYTLEYQRLDTLSQKNIINESYINYTVDFLSVNTGLNDIFKCCTSLQGQIMDCQNARLIK